MGLFKPSWKSIDPEKRRQAVSKLTDQEKLKKVAAQDADIDVRYAAIRRITDETFLAAYAAQINHRGLQYAAIEQIQSWPMLLQLAAACSKNSDICITCFKRIPVQLPREALEILYNAGGWAALLAAERTKDIIVLKKLENDYDEGVRHRAKWELEKIEKEQQINSTDLTLQRRLLRESDDPDVVLNAADKLNDEELILQRLIAEADSDMEGKWDLVKGLAGKIKEPASLRQLFALDNDRFRRCICEPVLKRMQEIEPEFVIKAAQSGDYDRTVRCAAVKLLTDPELLTEIGLTDSEVRYYVMTNRYFQNDQRVFAAVLSDPNADAVDVGEAAKRVSDPALILERLAFEKNEKLIGILCSSVSELKPYAEDIKMVLGSRPTGGVDYQKTSPSPTVTANLRRDADRKIAAWMDAAKRLIAFAETQPQVLLPLWNRLDAAITGAEAEIRYHRYLPTGSSEWDDGAQDFRFSFDEESWTEKIPTGLVFPKRQA